MSPVALFTCSTPITLILKQTYHAYPLTQATSAPAGASKSGTPMPSPPAKQAPPSSPAARDGPDASLPGATNYANADPNQGIKRAGVLQQLFH